jgi:hypothetical protein
MGLIKKLIAASLFILLFSFFATKTYAATLSNVSNTLTTSRPSASAPLAADQAANATQVTVIDLPSTIYNSALWIASDSAVLLNDTGQTLETARVASMSASNTPSSNQRTVFFTGQLSNTHHAGTTMYTSITATHIIKFTTVSSIPSGGKIVIGFPGSGSNIASPSATTFSFNNLQTSQVLCNPTSACAGGVSVSAPSITLTTNAAISGATTIYVAIGCTGTVNGSGICSTYSPALVNPVKGESAVGTADTWKVTVTTKNASDVDLDTASVRIGTIESVQVQGTVEPSLTFTITGLANATNINTQNSSCASGDITNPGTGLDATSTFVNLGSLANGVINMSAQELSVSTNGAFGYSITATSSGRFINPASGFFLTDNMSSSGLTAVDTPAPIVFPTTGNAFFGIHPCGADVNTTTWANAATDFNSGAKYSNPFNTGVNGYYANIASYSSPASARKTEVLYAATVGATTPAGTYSTVFTFVATGNF